MVQGGVDMSRLYSYNPSLMTTFTVDPVSQSVGVLHLVRRAAPREREGREGGGDNETHNMLSAAFRYLQPSRHQQAKESYSAGRRGVKAKISLKQYQITDTFRIWTLKLITASDNTVLQSMRSYSVGRTFRLIIVWTIRYNREQTHVQNQEANDSLR